MSDVSQALAEIPGKWATPEPAMVSKLNRGGGLVLDYVGHADTTLILIAIDPEYEYDWITNPDGSMLIRVVGQRLVLEGWMKLHGVTRKGVGTCQSNKSEPEKELIGDLLRNCAMRFGVSTALWSKAEGHESVETNREYAPPAAEPAGDSPSVATHKRLRKVVKGSPKADEIKRLAEQHGEGLTEEALRKASWRAVVDGVLDNTSLASEPVGDPEPELDLAGAPTAGDA